MADVDGSAQEPIATEKAVPLTETVVDAAGDQDLDPFDDEVGVDQDLTEDGGLKKRILVKGSGWRMPSKGDQVTVHYVGTLEDGTPFDSSRDRGEPFSFKLGVGQVIKGWDQGVASFKKGEKSLLICRGDYAYGPQGSPPKIPPNATLHFEVELLSWKDTKDISEAGDGGLVKDVIVEGSGWAKPGDRDEVLINYKATVDGSEVAFAASPDGGQEFTLSEGHLVPAIATAVRTMKKGEKASLLVQPPYAFGAAGRAPEVGSDTPVRIELELVSWKKVENVTDDGQVVLKELAEGKDTWKKPNEGAKVTLRYTARLPDGTVFDQQDGKTFDTDDGSLPLGLELAVPKMHPAGRFLLTVGPSYAYGEAGFAGPLAAVPPNTAITYEVELLQLENAKEMYELKDDRDKVAASLELKEKGNAAFKAGQNLRAVKLYKRALVFVEPEKSKAAADDVKSSFKDARKSCLLNLAAAQLKLAEYKDAIASCNKVLDMDGANIKALYRLAQAYMNNGDYVEAELTIKRGLQVEERNADMLALQKKLRVTSKAQDQKQSKVFAKMFAPRKATAAELAEEAAAKAATNAEAEAAAAATADGTPLGDVDMAPAAGEGIKGQVGIESDPAGDGRTA